MGDKIRCPHCSRDVAQKASGGGIKVRLAITLVDEDGRVHGPCPRCKQDVTVGHGLEIAKTEGAGPKLGLAIRRRVS